MNNMAYIFIGSGGVIVAIITLIFMFWQKGSADRDKRDIQQQEHGKTGETLRIINEKLDGICKKMNDSESRLDDIFERLIRTEEATAQAHRRIDEFRDKTYYHLNEKENKS